MIDRATNSTGERAQQPLTEEDLNQPIHVPVASVGLILFKYMKKSRRSDFLRAECIVRNIQIVMKANNVSTNFPKSITIFKPQPSEKQMVDAKSNNCFPAETQMRFLEGKR